MVMERESDRKRRERERKRLAGECYECSGTVVSGGRCGKHLRSHNSSSAFSAAHVRSKRRGKGRGVREMWYDLE